MIPTIEAFSIKKRKWLTFSNNTCFNRFNCKAICYRVIKKGQENYYAQNHEAITALEATVIIGKHINGNSSKVS